MSWTHSLKCRTNLIKTLIMIDNVLKTEVVGEENGTYAINCLLDNSVPFIDCSLAIDDEFKTSQSITENDERNEWEIRDDESNINWLVEKLRRNGEKIERKFVEKFYNDFVRGEMIYHRPEDSETLDTIIKTFNYLSNGNYD